MENTYKRDLIGGDESFGSLFSKKKKKKKKNSHFGQYWKQIQNQNLKELFEL